MSLIQIAGINLDEVVAAICYSLPKETEITKKMKAASMTHKCGRKRKSNVIRCISKPVKYTG